jgi:hypothetical protein
VQPVDEIPTIKELRPFLGYFNNMRRTDSNNCYPDHRGRITSKAQLEVDQKVDGLEMMCYSLSQHPIMGRVFARPS